MRHWGIAQAGGIGAQVFGDAGEDAVDSCLLFGGLGGRVVGGLESSRWMKRFERRKGAVEALEG